MYTLHYSPSSPYARKVMVLAHETSQVERIHISAATGSPLDPGTIPIGQNPLGKIPALERPEGCTLYDSRVICRFLAQAAPSGAPALYPDGPRLWEVLTLEATGDGMMDAALLMRYESVIRPEGARHTGWLDGQWAKIERSLAALEARWMAHLAGPLCMGQIAVGCALGYLDFRFAARDWRADHPHLADWFAQFCERPSMQATLPPAT
jgi:glutathione S-transferase